MSVSTTANLGLTLPYQTDPVAVSEQNSNMGLIDGFAGDEWANMGIVETGVTATHAIAAGQYVIWKGILYTADSAISVGTTLSRGGSGSSGTKNLTAVSNGGFNALNSNFAYTKEAIVHTESDVASEGHADISYPSGFTRDNCYVSSSYFISDYYDRVFTHGIDTVLSSAKMVAYNHTGSAHMLYVVLKKFNL